jgi:cation transport ATPase
MKDGSDIAKEVADITLLSENLDGLIALRSLSASLFTRIHRNYRTIVGFNTSLLLLGVGGVIAPSTSAFLHNASTMLLSGTSMRRYLGERVGDSIS